MYARAKGTLGCRENHLVLASWDLSRDEKVLGECQASPTWFWTVLREPRKPLFAEETGFDESCGKSLLRPPGSELRVTDLPLSSM